MTEYILMAAMAALTVLILFLRANAAVCFMAVCAGSVLVEASGSNMGLVASSLTSGYGSASMIAQIVLLFVPLLACLWLVRGQVPKSLLILNFIPAVCTALLSAMLLIPLLPEDIRSQITDVQTWQLMTQYYEFVVGAGLVSSILLISMTIKKPHDKHKKGHH